MAITTYKSLYNAVSANGRLAGLEPDAAGKVPPEQLQTLFNTMRDITDLHFDANDNGCVQRCNLMQEIMIKAGIKPLTVFVDIPENFYKQDITFKHFAPAVYNAKTNELVIIDPAYSDKPESKTEFAERFNEDPRAVTVDDFFIGSKNTDGDLKKISAYAKEQKSKKIDALTPV